MSVQAGHWHDLGSQELEADLTYYVKCRPGAVCDVLIETTPEVSGPWEVVLEFSVDGEPPAGVYRIFCRTGGGSKCQVCLVAAEPDQE